MPAIPVIDMSALRGGDGTARRDLARQFGHTFERVDAVGIATALVIAPISGTKRDPASTSVNAT